MATLFAPEGVAEEVGAMTEEVGGLASDVVAISVHSAVGGPL